MMKPGLRFSVLMATFFLSACGFISERLIQKPVDARSLSELAAARELVITLKAQNRGLKTFKGTGKFKYWHQGKPLTSRLAWMGAYPDKLRIVVRSVSGQPTASLASDGQWFYLVSHLQQKFDKKRTSNPTLQGLLSIPINSRDIVAILSGRIPFRAHHTAELVKDKSGKGYILYLKKKWAGVQEKIYLDEKQKTIQQLEMLDISGDLVYRVIFIGRQAVNGYEVPSQVLISNDEGDRFQLDIERYWTNVLVSPSTFILTSPHRK